MSDTVIQKPDNFLTWAILCTCLCCVPFGIVAIVHSVKVDLLWEKGQTDEAVKEAATARKWVYIGAGSSVAFCVIYLIVLLIVALCA